MSVTMTLIPLAVALGLSLSAGSTAILLRQEEHAGEELPVLETAFVDRQLLLTTLQRHGLQVECRGEEELLIRSEAGELRYFREEEGLPFRLEVRNVTNLRELLQDVDELENEYGRNVQTFTYTKVMTGLMEHGLTLASEEVLEDESILLTLNI